MKEPPQETSSAALQREQLASDLRAAGIRSPRRSRARLLMWLGAGLMAVAIGLLIYGYTVVHGTDNALDQRDGLAVGNIGLGVAVIGSALFLYGAVAEFLRFWMVRLGHHLENRPKSE